VRTFIAVDFPEEILGKIGKIVAFFKTQTPEHALKWVDPGIMHLTLKFIGEIPENALHKVQDMMTLTLQDQHPFNLTIEGLGMYPNYRNPRAVWLGISYDQALIKIHKKLDQELARINIPSEKRAFSPHLTVARLRRNIETQTARSIGETLSQFKVDTLGTVLVQDIQLYQSQLTPTGPIYTRLLTIPLNLV